VTVGQRGPGASDGRVDGAVPCAAVKAEVERDDSVKVGWMTAMMWTWRRQWRHRRGRGKFWQPDDIQVKILRLGFKDRAAGVL
jgi:hypothetical protein